MVNPVEEVLIDPPVARPLSSGMRITSRPEPREWFHDPCSAAKASPEYSGGKHLAVVEGHAKRRRYGPGIRTSGTVTLSFNSGCFAWMSRILIAADVEPRGQPIEAAARDVRHVIGDQVVAQHVAFVHGGPQFARFGINREAHGISNSRRIDADELAFGSVLEDVGAVEFGFGVAIVGRRSYRPGTGSLPSLEKTMSRVEMSAARGNVRDQLFGLSAGLEIAVLIGVSHQRSGVGDIEPTGGFGPPPDRS